MNKPASFIPFSPFRWNAIKRATAVPALASLAACGGGNDASTPKLGFAAVPEAKIVDAVQRLRQAWKL